MKPLRTKKEIILEAAFHVYKESGFVNVRMEDIAKRAGVGKGTMYQYFQSKEMLLEATIENCILGYTNTLEDIFDASLSFKESLEKWVNFHIYVMSQSDGMMELMHSEGFALSKELKAKMYSHRQRLYTLMKVRIEEDVTKGNFPKMVEPSFVMAMLFGTITHYFVPKNQAVDVLKMNAEDFASHMLKLIQVEPPIE